MNVLQVWSRDSTYRLKTFNHFFAPHKGCSIAEVFIICFTSHKYTQGYETVYDADLQTKHASYCISCFTSFLLDSLPSWDARSGGGDPCWWGGLGRPSGARYHPGPQCWGRLPPRERQMVCSQNRLRNHELSYMYSVSDLWVWCLITHELTVWWSYLEPHVQEIIS